MTTNGHTNEGKLFYQLMERMAGVVPIPGEEDFFVRPDTLRRFLKARNWDVDEAEKILKGAVEWRKKNDAIHMDCKWCHDNPGHHSIRQVGFDLLGRPVIYSCFVQATAVPTVEDTVSHCTYLIENAQKVMENGVSTWVFILDCRGMSLPACNPKIGYGLTQVFANFYPERLGLVICLHHNPIFHGVWNGIKVFLHENTVAKMHLLRAKKKIVEEFNRLFNPELRDWLFEEMRFNKMKPLPLSQRTFWKAPSNPKDHDPRGCSSYVSEYINKYLKNVNKDPESTHRPHPNIVDELKGICKPLRTDLAKLEDDGPSTASNHGQIDEDSESEESACLHRLESIEISSEYQIPEDAVRLQS